ncbi:CRTAC1 family protein [Flavobacteriaceae bacterium]|jgi:enediyne biosynthesis protein E4|nr:CRTAC1 family protein [Flavobacteriaceae bacterium]
MYRRIFLLLCFSIFVKVQGQQFTDITNQSGIDHYFEVYEGMFGGGIAVLDYNNDGFEDLYITGGMQEDQLLENLQNGTFKNILKTARLESVLRFVTQGVAAADFNRDGWMDLFVTTITTKSQKRKIPRAQNLIFINQGDGTFKNNSKSFGIQRIESFSTGISVGDFNLDGYPDLYVGNYFTDYDGGLKEISDATIVNAGKTAKGYLYENKGGKRFKEVSEKYNIDHRGFSFGGIFTDFDNDNDLDLIVNNDFGYKAKPNYLLENLYPKKEFQYVGENYEMDLRINAMGGATADINADGFLDYFISNIRYNRFMIQDPEKNIFEDQAEALGTQLFTISWGANFNDFDHDGDIDLFVSNGDLNPNCVPMYNFFFENVNGQFKEESTKFGLKDYGVGRGSAIFDLENDGDMDLIVVSQKPIREYGPPSITRLYRNDIEKGNYLQVKLKGNASTLSAHGARIQVFSDSLFINQEIDGGNTSHLSHNSTLAHFGLGKRKIIDSLKVIWPGGEITKMNQIKTNQKIFVEETQEFKKRRLNLIWWLLPISALGFYFFIRNKKKQHKI